MHEFVSFSCSRTMWTTLFRSLGKLRPRARGCFIAAEPTLAVYRDAACSVCIGHGLTIAHLLAASNTAKSQSFNQSVSYHQVFNPKQISGQYMSLWSCILFCHKYRRWKNRLFWRCTRRWYGGCSIVIMEGLWMLTMSMWKGGSSDGSAQLACHFAWFWKKYR